MQATYHRPHTPVVKNNAAAAALAAAQWTNNSGVEYPADEVGIQQLKLNHFNIYSIICLIILLHFRLIPRKWQSTVLDYMLKLMRNTHHTLSTIGIIIQNKLKLLRY